ncbi:MAG: ankyrin repeat domain-containing protein [Oligoflexia bacterium]|nr:ankyrin repeat domain-containing protein [Oligoflexia bacterium]
MKRYILIFPLLIIPFIIQADWEQPTIMQDGLNKEKLFLAIIQRDEQNIQKLLENHPYLADVKDDLSRTGLMIASWKGYLKIAEFFIQAKAKINTRDRNGQTALMMASYWGYLDIVNMLLKAGAKVNMQDNLGQTALIKTSMWGFPKVSRTLIHALADSNIKDQSGMTVLMRAIQFKRPLVVQAVLLDNTNINIDSIDKKGNTALIIASQRGERDILKQLLDFGANPEIVNKEGLTALDYSVFKQQTQTKKSNYAEIEKLLRRALCKKSF